MILPKIMQYAFHQNFWRRKKNVSFLIDNQRNTIKVNTKCKIFFLRFENWNILIIQIIIILVYIHLLFYILHNAKRKELFALIFKTIQSQTIILCDLWNIVIINCENKWAHFESYEWNNRFRFRISNLLYYIRFKNSEQGQNSQNFLGRFIRFFITLRCFYRVVIHRK